LPACRNRRSRRSRDHRSGDVGDHPVDEGGLADACLALHDDEATLRTSRLGEIRRDGLRLDLTLDERHPAIGTGRSRSPVDAAARRVSLYRRDREPVPCGGAGEQPHVQRATCHA